MIKLKNGFRKAKQQKYNNFINKDYYKAFECEICHEKTPIFAESKFEKRVCCACWYDKVFNWGICDERKY